jgi:hypothetical protein
MGSCHDPSIQTCLLHSLHSSHKVGGCTSASTKSTPNSSPIDFPNAPSPIRSLGQKQLMKEKSSRKLFCAVHVRLQAVNARHCPSTPVTSPSRFSDCTPRCVASATASLDAYQLAVRAKPRFLRSKSLCLQLPQ